MSKDATSVKEAGPSLASTTDKKRPGISKRVIQATRTSARRMIMIVSPRMNCTTFATQTCGRQNRSISSSVLPFVSGTANQTNTQPPRQIAPYVQKVPAGPRVRLSRGNV